MNNKENILIDDDLQEMIDLDDGEDFFDADFEDEEFDDEDVTEIKLGDNKSELPGSIKNKSIELLQYYLGDRELEPFDNSDILRCRLFYQVKLTRKSYCSYIINKKNKRKLGLVSNMQLRHSWRMAHSKDAKKAVKNDLFFMTYQEWEEDLAALEKYIRKKLHIDNSSHASHSLVYFSDVWNLSEIEYESAGLKKPQQFMALLQTAILGEIRENKRIVRSWRKIKKYMYRVHLEASKGGIFSDEDAAKIRASFKRIKYLNDIRRYNIYILKSIGLEFDFEKIVKDINKAYKEDMARRKDRRYKVRPFISAFCNLALVIFISYSLKYQLLYAPVETAVIMTLLTFCVLNALFIVFAGLRGKRRRLVRPDYVYYTKRVKRAIGTFAFVGLFTVMSVFVFYQRYDGYENNLYYREKDDDTIAIAGMVNDYAKKLEIPDTIAGKTVTEIDLYAFDNESITQLVLPYTLKKIDTSAFAGCYNLSSVEIPYGVEEIGKSAFSNTGIVTLTLQEDVNIKVDNGAFKNCYKMKIIENAKSIISIGNSAFSGCYNLREMVFSDSIEFIGNRAFYGCLSIKSIYVPTTIEKIGRGAFSYCSNLTYLSVPFAGTSAETSYRESIQSIIRLDPETDTLVDVVLSSPAPLSGRAFKNVKWIKSLVLHDGISEIKAGAFSGTDNLEEINIPASVTEINKNLFNGANSLKKISGMSDVTSIGDGAFKGCSDLQYIDISNVKNIGNNAFSGCFKLNDVTFSGSLKTIGKKAFYGCTSITSIYVPSTTEKIGKGAFHNCNGLRYISVPFAGTSAENSHREKIESIIKINTGSYNLVELTINAPNAISGKAFANVKWIKSLILHDGIPEIKSGAFSGMDNLVEVKLPASVTEINKNLFKGASSLKAISGMSGVVSIGERAFYGCNSLESINLSNVKNIGSEAFNSCYNLSSIGNMNALESIGSNAFKNCYQLKGTLALPSTLKVIGEYAFANSHFSSVQFNNGLKEIGAHAFENCNYITSINSIPSTVKTIGEYAFSGCYSLEYVNMSSTTSVKLGKYALSSCKSLRSVYLPSDTTEIVDGLFYGCSSFSINSIDNFDELNISTIGESAFEGCSIASEILEIPNSVRTIGKRAFAKTGMVRLVVGNNVTKIGKEAFDGCSYITTATVPFLGENRTDSSTSFLGMGKNGGYTWVFGSSKVENITITNMNTIYTNTFGGGDDYVEAVTISSGTSKIEKSAFEGFEKLKTVTLATSVTSIGKKAFKNCTALGTINIPTAVTTIESSTFENCRRLTIDFSELRVRTIKSRAFYGCNNIKNHIVFSSSLREIENGAFANCYNIYSVTLPRNLTDLDVNAFGMFPDLIIYVYTEDDFDEYTELFKNYPDVVVSIIDN